MLSKKSIYETLAALSAGAMVMSGCAGAQSPVNATEVPAAEQTAPAATAEPTPASAPVETTSGDAAAGANVPAAPAEPAPASDAQSAATAPKVAPTATLAATAAPPGPPVPAAAPAKPAAKKAAAGKKPGHAGCGQGTCG
ncbi:hypothetical protein [Sorangium sp. So ce1000]|uniref:hypothetical protein n=1 Tax=Sorangium sp. So ce1000 TaxID=3133325 RepID=UPI003F5DFF63